MEDFSKYSNMKYDENNNFIYYISNENGLPNLWRFNMESSEKFQLTDEKQNVTDYWLEENNIIIAIDYNGNERNQFYKLKEDMSLETVINDSDFFHHYGIYENESQNLYLTRNKFNSESFDLCVFKKNNDLEILTHFDMPINILSIIGHDKLLLAAEVNNIAKQLFIYNIETSDVFKVPLSPSRFSDFKVIDKSNYAYCLSDWDNGFMNIYKIDLNDWSYHKVTSFNWDIENIQWSKNFKNAEVVLNENGCSILYHFNLATDDITQHGFRKDGVIHSMKKIENDHLLILYSSVDVPHCIINYNIDEDNSEIILKNTGDANKVKWEMLSYHSFDGLKIPYFIYKSENKEKRPAVIYIHGGPESQERPEFKELYYQLNQQGASVIIPNIRGSKGYGRFYLELDNQTKRLDAMQDIISLRECLITRHKYDSDNISLMGISYGGFMTLLLITHHPQLWKMAVDIVGISHLSTFLNNTSPWRRKQRSSEYGFLGEHDEFFEEISPLPRAKDITTPLIVFHSIHDSRVPNSESVQIVESMQKNNQDVSFTSYENEGHVYTRKESINDMNNKIIQFLMN